MRAPFEVLWVAFRLTGQHVQELGLLEERLHGQRVEVVAAGPGAGYKLRFRRLFEDLLDLFEAGQSIGIIMRADNGWGPVPLQDLLQLAATRQAGPEELQGLFQLRAFAPPYFLQPDDREVGPSGAILGSVRVHATQLREVPTGQQARAPAGRRHPKAS